MEHKHSGSTKNSQNYLFQEIELSKIYYVKLTNNLHHLLLLAIIL